MELLVGLLQAVVFALLCAVYIQLATSTDEEDH
jgi:F-type H+-transporting ATPase subunit a